MLPNNSNSMNGGSNFNPQHLVELANYRMPFGKYKNRLLLEIPEYYYLWFQRQGFPPGKLGRMMQEMLEIKVNELEDLLKPLVKRR